MAELKHIQEYIGTEDGTAGTLLIPKLILPILIEEIEKALIPRELAAQFWGPAQIQGSSFSVNLESPDTMDVRQVGEGAEVSMDAGEYSSVTYTPKKYGVAVRITREMIEDSQFPILEAQLRVAGKRFAEKENELILTALDGAGTTVAGGAAITLSNITEAMAALENNSYSATDMIIGNEVLQDLRNIDTFVEASKAGNTEMLNKGFLGNIYGMNVVRFDDKASPTAGTYKKYAYIIDRSQAYGLAVKRDLTVENFDLPTYDMQGACLTWRFDVQLLRSNAVAKITTT
jgi:HK97 family phage major capsid protein